MRAAAFVTGEPGPGGTIQLTTVFDTNPFLVSDTCPLVAEIPVDEAGEFLALGAACDATRSDPFMLAMLSSSPSAKVAVHRQVFCPPTGSDCTAWDVTIEAPARAVVSAWTAEAETDGMITSSGLVLIRFVDFDGSPSAGVSPAIMQQGSILSLIPPGDVRFVADDGVTLLPPTADRTGASGLSLVSPALLGFPFPSLVIEGFRSDGAASFEAIEVVTREGLVYFTEIRRVE